MITFGGPTENPWVDLNFESQVGQMGFTTLVIITMLNQLLGGECYHANVLPICR